MIARGLGLVFGLALMAAAYVVYREMQFLGFPDGHKTELERALAPLYGWLTILSATCGVYVLYLALRSSVRQRERKLKAAAVIYLLLVAISAAAGYALSLGLDDGAGG